MGAKEAKFSLVNWFTVASVCVTILIALVSLIAYQVESRVESKSKQSYTDGRVYEMKGELMIYQKSYNQAEIQIAVLEQEVEDLKQRIVKIEDKLYGLR